MKLPSRESMDLISALLLGVAALATSWIGYESSRWSGRQSSSINESSVLRMESNRAAGEAAMLRLVDIGGFANWINAYASGNEALDAFYRKRFRNEFRPAFEAWLAQKPRLNPEAASSPFAVPEYRLASALEAERLEAQAETRYRDGQAEGGIKDRYVGGTVLLAAAMFFAGISRQFPKPALQAAVLVFAALLCLTALSIVISLPIIV